MSRVFIIHNQNPQHRFSPSRQFKVHVSTFGRSRKNPLYFPCGTAFRRHSFCNTKKRRSCRRKCCSTAGSYDVQHDLQRIAILKGWYGGGAAPPYEIRRTGFAGSRRIFAEMRLPTESENSFPAGFAPGKSVIFSKIRRVGRYAYCVSPEGGCAAAPAVGFTCLQGNRRTAGWLRSVPPAGRCHTAS